MHYLTITCCYPIAQERYVLYYAIIGCRNVYQH